MASINVTKLGQVIKLLVGAAPASPENGMVYYDASSNVFKFYQNGTWINLGDASALLASSISDGDITHAPDGNSVFDALAGKSDSSHNHSGVYDPAGTAAGIIASSISDGDTTHCPDGNSVFDALAGKSDTSHNHSGVYDPAGTAAGIIASSISDGDTSHCPDGNSVYDALAGKLGTSATAADSSKLNGQSASFYLAASEKGAASGLCPLGADTKVAAAYLPSYVDDVEEYANFASFPTVGAFAAYTGTPAGCSTSVTITANNKGTAGNVTLTGDGSKTISVLISDWNTGHPTNPLTLTLGDGDQVPNNAVDMALTGGINVAAETSKIYVDLATNKIWRFSGTVYVEISPSPGSTDAVPEGATNKYYTPSTARTDLIASSISDGDTTHAPNGNSVFDALAGKSDSSHNHSGVYDPAGTAAGIIASSISDGDTTHCPDGNSVYDALAGKLGTSATAADSSKLNGQEASYYATASALSAKLSNVEDDTSPTLGGDLDASDEVIFDANGLRLGSSATEYQLNKYVHAQTLTASQTNAVASNFTFAFATYSSCVLEYQIKEATTGRVRSGQLFVSTDGTDVAIADSHTETADCGVTWTGGINGSNVEIKYTTTANNKTMRAMQKLFLA